MKKVFKSLIYFSLLILFAILIISPINKYLVFKEVNAQTDNSTSLKLLKDILDILFPNNATNNNIHNPLTPNPTIVPGNFPPLNTSKLSNIINWTTRINDRLSAENTIWPPWWYFNVLLNPPSNGGYSARYSPATSWLDLYWCTFLSIDSYALAGLRELTYKDYSATIDQQKFFMTQNRYTYVSYSVIFTDYNASPPQYRITSPTERKQTLDYVQPGCVAIFQVKAGRQILYGNHVAILKSKNYDSNYNGYVETYDANNTSKVVRYPVSDGTIQNTPFTQGSLRGFGCPAL